MTSPTIPEIQLTNGLFMEASAGTGKTYTVAALVAREIALHDSLRISELLITTFTRNAAAELKDRVRRRLIDTAEVLRTGHAPSDDVLGRYLVALGTKESSTERMEANLRRAAVEFDTATVSTIHSVCSKILSIAGLPSGSGSESDSRGVTIKQKVNDFVAAESMRGRLHDPVLIEKLVAQVLSAPDASLWIDPSLDPAVRVHLATMAAEITRIAGLVEMSTRDKPTHDDLLQRAAMVVRDPAYAVALEVIRGRYRIAFVDEAQDTDPLQWDIFRAVIPAVSSEGVLVVVGDPKQSIYRFRGADIGAYVAQRDPQNRISLDRNFRSDEDLVNGLNTLLAGKTYGQGITYEHVGFDPNKAGRRVSGVEPIEVIDIGSASGATAPEVVAANRVAQLLHTARVEDEPIRPSDICVLVKANEIGLALEKRLRNMRIPAVSGGTSSVMASEAAVAVTRLLEALERPRDLGRVRAVMATMFFGRSLLDPALLSMDETNEIDGIADEHDLLVSLGKLLRSEGIAAVRARILAEPACSASILGSDRAERRMTDLNHVVELIHQRSGGSGVDASGALQFLADLSALDSTAEIVSRRVESDSDAVKILTIHAAKGLEFPFVVVADKWNERKAVDNKDGSRTADEKPVAKPVMFLGAPDQHGKRSRLIDVSWVTDGIPSPAARTASEAEDREEMARQFYVAVTRAEHHLTLLLPDETAEKSLAREFVNEDAFGVGTPIPLLQVPAVQPRYSAGSVDTAQATQPFDADTTQTYRRTSFTGITETAEGLAVTHHSPTGGGNDERDVFFDLGRSSADADVPTGVDMPLARIPGGTHTGTVIHEIFENFDPSPEGTQEQFARLVARHASGPSLAPHRGNLVRGLAAAAATNLGPFMHGRSLATIGAADRLAELGFEMGLPELSQNVTVNTVGELLESFLPADDILRDYASELTGPQFRIPLAGLVNGSIDAVLRIDVPGSGPQLYITDYKSNRLDTEEDLRLIDAYHPARLVGPMRHHHYPLQAIIYGVAVHRFLRWRAPHLDSDDVIAGVAYFFVRGMVNNPEFVDEHGCPYGVFQWRAPRGLWAALSDALSGGAQ